jgi:hypothetical protein
MHKIILRSFIVALAFALHAYGADAQTPVQPSSPPPGQNGNCTIRASVHTTICLVTGAIAIPFRAELTGNKDVLGGISGDLFVGANLNPDKDSNFYGALQPTLLVYVGYLPTLSSSTAGGSSSGSSTSGALDFGVGVALPIPSGVNPSSNQTSHIGVVLGTDQTSTSNHYEYNGKLYLSVFAGLSF